MRNQLGRRNLSDIDRIKIANRYKEVISKRLKEEQIESASKGGKIYSPVFGRKDMDKYPEPSREPTTTRKELAKIAGVGA